MSAPRPILFLGYRAMMLDGLAREVEITKKVLAAVPEEKENYRPDPARAHGLGTGLAHSPTRRQFMDGIGGPEVHHGPIRRRQTSPRRWPSWWIGTTGI